MRGAPPKEDVVVDWHAALCVGKPHTAEFWGVDFFGFEVDLKVR
jgi:hypothetical protein